MGNKKGMVRNAVEERNWMALGIFRMKALTSMLSKLVGGSGVLCFIP